MAVYERTLREPDSSGAPAPGGQELPAIAVVIPCYRVREAVVDVVQAIGPWAAAVYCVDDACPERSGDAVAEAFADDPRVHVLRRQVNGGVGAATITGYRAALAEGADILVKVDGDGQMDPGEVMRLVRPILDGEADYVKGNRFFSAETVARMPWTRVVGNAGLSFLSKLSTGYWDLFDPTNGFTALEGSVARELPLDKVHPRYFFESDILFRLGILRARVMQLPQHATYAGERSNLSELRALLTFPFLHARNLAKRIAYNYFLRNFSLASVNLVAGLALAVFGVVFGAWQWSMAAQTGSAATSGTVMLSALPVLLGIQLLLQFLSYDMASTPGHPLHRSLTTVQVLGAQGDDPG